MPPRITEQRHQANIESVRCLVDARSPSLVRDAVAGSKIGGSRRRYPLPSIGYRSGKLTVTGYIVSSRGGVSAIVVKCDCNAAEYKVDQQNFKNFRSTRCPLCAKKAAAAKRYWVYSEAMADDDHRTRLLNRLAAAVTRCHTPSDRAYKHYGERGIRVCPEWRFDRAEFLRYVQTLEGWDNPAFEMDRINVDGHYEPGNIRFVSRSDNLYNKRKVADLEARIRHLEQRLSQQVHHPD
jgi:hypothetical protein